MECAERAESTPGCWSADQIHKRFHRGQQTSLSNRRGLQISRFRRPHGSRGSLVNLDCHSVDDLLASWVLTLSGPGLTNSVSTRTPNSDCCLGVEPCRQGPETNEKGRCEHSDPVGNTSPRNTTAASLKSQVSTLTHSELRRSCCPAMDHCHRKRLERDRGDRSCFHGETMGLRERAA